MNLGHIQERFPDSSTVLFLDPLLQTFAPHQMKHAVLQPRQDLDNMFKNRKSYFVSTPEVDKAFKNVDGNSLSVTMGDATSFWRSSISSGYTS